MKKVVLATYIASSLLHTPAIADTKELATMKTMCRSKILQPLLNEEGKKICEELRTIEEKKKTCEEHVKQIEQLGGEVKSNPCEHIQNNSRYLEKLMRKYGITIVNMSEGY